MNLSHLVQNNEGEWYFDRCIMGYRFPPSPQAPPKVTQRVVGGVGGTSSWEKRRDRDTRRIQGQPASGQGGGWLGSKAFV